MITFFVFENLIFLVLRVLVLKFLDHIVGFLSALDILQVVHVKLMLKVIDICILLDVNVVEALKFNFKTLVLFLVFWFDVVETFKAFLCTLKLLSAALDLVLELSLVLSKLFDCFDHFTHFPLLGVDDITDAFLDVLLFAVRIEVARNRLQEANCVVSCLLKFLLTAKHVEKFSTRLCNFSSQNTSGFQVLQF
jgi:hypothetical protein